MAGLKVAGNIVTGIIGFALTYAHRAALDACLLRKKKRSMTSGRREFPDRPMIGIGIAVLHRDKVLMIRRGRPPAEGAWSLPGGAQKLGETAEQAARRELAEETGLSVGALHLAGCVDSIHADPGGAIRYHYTIVDFCCWYTGGEARAGGDAMDIAWVDLGRLDDYDVWSETRRIIAASEKVLMFFSEEKNQKTFTPGASG